ncbi:DUF402 domain-containing protein [Streptomonospora sp. PA3]|uniref:DUF402 domain-containing protein n=1 Tax=Streptomonospora sp. PA3 TaxID=2607326 RepID=UPI001CA3B7BE|nr:DUF402 domain-containing protein [Streptomonospora sp. PA3]
MSERYRPGQVVTHWETVDGASWLSYPVRVVADNPDLFAVYLAAGTPMTFGEGTFRLGPHPWRSFGPAWKSAGVVQLHRPGDWYAVWAVTGRRDGFRGWYVNFQEPFRRVPGGFETLDHDLDLEIPAGDPAAYRWKDVDEFEARAARGDFTESAVEAVRADAGRVAAMLDTGTTWWDRSWLDWRAPKTWDYEAVHAPR